MDFSLTECPPKKSSLYSEVLFIYNLYLIAPINHPFINKKEIPLSKISKEIFIIGKHRSNSQKILEDKVINKESKLIGGASFLLMASK
ncbi:hypothetical protein [Candidiatus Paracoxiella cheracis]|uniref:hypothetical protein n=1 Tax=Candidiatus Paracoxiella cheracis TaxID=3405120 RepID=UPI003BF564B0